MKNDVINTEPIQDEFTEVNEEQEPLDVIFVFVLWFGAWALLGAGIIAWIVR